MSQSFECCTTYIKRNLAHAMEVVMGDKDLSEKMLLGLNDVFADVCNAFVFDEPGKIKPEELQPYPTESVVGDVSGLKQGFRDVAKVYRQCGINMLLLGIEDQTAIDYDMAARVMFADAMHYHNLCEVKTRANAKNIDETKDDNNTLKQETCTGKTDELPKTTRFPVITVVLYFGMEQRWTGPRSLHEWLKLPPELEKLVNDYKITVVEVAYLTPEARNKLRSDFGDLADILREFKKRGELPSSNRKISHPRELAAAVKAITGVEIDMKTNEHGEITMNSTVQKYIQTLRDEGRNELLSDLLGQEVSKDLHPDKVMATRLMAEHIEKIKREAIKEVEMKLIETQQQANAAQQQANAAQQQANAAQQQANAAQQQANAAQQQANAANTMITNLIRNFNGSTEEIARITQLSIEEVEAIRQSKD